MTTKKPMFEADVRRICDLTRALHYEQHRVAEILGYDNDCTTLETLVVSALSDADGEVEIIERKLREALELRVAVPTYWGHAPEATLDFADPAVPVLVTQADGLRVVLGSHDYNDNSKPDVQIERRPNGWAIFLHPVGGGDPCGVVYFHDDGRSWFMHESPQIASFGTPRTEILNAEHDTPEEIDADLTS